MNYYPFNVGDYASHTGHLEPMEDLAYRRLLDIYYLREGPLPADIEATAKLVRMRSMAADVQSVLEEFFELTEDGWRHHRCDAEISKMQDKQAKARASASASVNARRTSVQRSLNERSTEKTGDECAIACKDQKSTFAERTLNGRSTNVQENATDAQRTLPEIQTNVELPTPIPIPTPINTPTGVQGGKPPRAPADPVELPVWMPTDSWEAFVAMRKAKGKRNPFTPGAARLAVAQLEKFRAAGHDPATILDRSTLNGWAGLFTPDNREQRSAGAANDWTANAV